MHTITEIDTDHDTHKTYLVETVKDNAVEFTRWMHCVDCDIDYKEISTTIVQEDDDESDDLGDVQR